MDPVGDRRRERLSKAVGPSFSLLTMAFTKFTASKPRNVGVALIGFAIVSDINVYVFK